MNEHFVILELSVSTPIQTIFVFCHWVFGIVDSPCFVSSGVVCVVIWIWFVSHVISPLVFQSVWNIFAWVLHCLWRSILLAWCYFWMFLCEIWANSPRSSYSFFALKCSLWEKWMWSKSDGTHSFLLAQIPLHIPWTIHQIWCTQWHDHNLQCHGCTQCS